MTMPLSVSRHPAHQQEGLNVLTIASGKGGVGKTVIAISLAQAMSALGKRVLLFDGDMGLANIDIQLGLCPEHDLGEVIARTATLDDIVLPFQEGGFDIIAGQSGSGLLGALPVTWWWSLPAAGLCVPVGVRYRAARGFAVGVGAGVALWSVCAPGMVAQAAWTRARLRLRGACR